MKAEACFFIFEISSAVLLGFQWSNFLLPVLPRKLSTYSSQVELGSASGPVPWGCFCWNILKGEPTFHWFAKQLEIIILLCGVPVKGWGHKWDGWLVQKEFCQHCCQSSNQICQVWWRHGCGDSEEILAMYWFPWVHPDFHKFHLEFPKVGSGVSNYWSGVSSTNLEF